VADTEEAVQDSGRNQADVDHSGSSRSLSGVIMEWSNVVDAVFSSNPL
jgi:hypothetical protein